MKKLLLPLVIGSIALPASALEQQVVEAWESSLNLPEISVDVFDSYNMSANAQRERMRKNPWLHKNGPKRTRIFSGIEMIDNTYERNPKRSEFKKVLFDGNTKFHNNWRMRYALVETNVTRGKDGEMIDAPSQWMKLSPRFEQTLSPTANWFVELEYTNFSAFGRRGQDPRFLDSDTYLIKVGGNKRFGRHNFNAHIDYRYREEASYQYDDDWDVEEINYYDAQNPRFQVGYRFRYNRYVQFQLRHNQHDNHLDEKNVNQYIKVSASHGFKNGLRSEISFQRNRNLNTVTDTGYYINRISSWNAYELTPTMQALFEVSYREYTRTYTENRIGNGNRRQLFSKIGINFSF